MKPMNLSYRILVWLYICPSENSTSRWTKLFRLGISIVLAIIFALLFIGSAVFCQQNVYTNLEIALFGILQMISAAALIHLFFTAHVLRHEFIYIFRSLQQIYDQGKSNEKKKHIFNANPFLFQKKYPDNSWKRLINVPNVLLNVLSTHLLLVSIWLF